MTPVVLPPSAGTPAPAATTAGHPSVLATVPDPPPAAARLEAGSIVTGTVLGRDAQGLVAIRTDKGVLALATHANLPVGSTVSMEVRVAGTRLQVVVLSVELPPGHAGQPTAGQPMAGQPIPGTGTPVGGTPPATAMPAAPTTPAATLALASSGGNLVMATVVHVSAGRPGTPPPGTATTPGPAAQAPGQAIGPPLPAAPLPEGQRPAGQVPTGQPPAAGLPPGGHAPTPGTPLAAGPVAAPGPVPGQVTLQPAIAALLNATAALDVELTARVAGTPTGTLAAQPAAAGAGAAAPLPQGLAAQQPLPSPAPNAAGSSQPQTALQQPALQQAPTPPLTQPHASLPQPSLPMGAEIGVRILAAALPGEPQPMAGPRPAGALPLATGTVVGRTPAGHPIVDTDAGRLVLAVKAALPAGTMLLLEVPPQALPDAALPAPSSSTPQQALLRLSQGWPDLGAALAALVGAGDMAAVHALAARLPQAGPQLAAGLMTMLGQLAAGEAGDWVGPALRQALERVGKRELADRLQGEFRQLSRLAAEPSAGDWRVMFLPLRHGEELHQVNLYLRGRRKNGGKDAPDTGTRFVVEVDMTRLGPLQLDGLVQGRRFDLMLRSRMPLSPAMRRDIEAIFDQVRGLGGFAGTIGFQIAASFPVQPLEQARRKSAAAGVVV